MNLCLFDKVFYEDKTEQATSPNNFLKKIPVWIYWDKGWENAPLISKYCLKNWKLKHKENSKFSIEPIDLYDVNNLLDLSYYKNKRIDPTAYSDIIRIELIKNYGGVWTDSTVFCNHSLDNWLYKILLSHDFWCYEGHSRDYINSSYFFASKNNKYIINEWHKSCINYWSTRISKHTYFWVFMLFSDLYQNDTSFKILYDNIPKMNALASEDGPHIFVPYRDRIFNKINTDIKNYIDNSKSHIFKLTRHKSRGCEDYKLHDDNYAINYLLKKHHII